MCVPPVSLNKSVMGEKILKAVIVLVIAAGLTSPLLWEEWFSFRMWAVLTMLISMAYYLYYIGQKNRYTVGKTILEKMDRLLGGNNKGSNGLS